MTANQQSQLDKVAAILLLVASIGATIINYFTKQGFWSPYLSHAGLLALLIIQPLYLVQLYYISESKRWAKILYLALGGLGLIGWVLNYKSIAAKTFTTPAATLNIISQQVVAFLVLVLLALTLRKPEPDSVTEEELY